MKTQTNMAIKARIIRWTSYLLLLGAGPAMAFFGAQGLTKVPPRTLTFAERVSYQRAMEKVYWQHRIWPQENPNPKPTNVHDSLGNTLGSASASVGILVGDVLGDGSVGNRDIDNVRTHLGEQANSSNFRNDVTVGRKNQ